VSAYLAVAAAAQRCKQEAVAISCLEKAKSVRAQVRLGDLLVAKKDWARAAEAYRKGHQIALKGPPTPALVAEDAPELTLFLHGWALARAGKAAEGNKLMERAHWVPLGGARARYDFSFALSKRGHKADADREYDLLRRTGEPTLTDLESFYTGEGLLWAGTVALRNNDYAKAVLGLEQAMMRSQRPVVNFRNPVAHVGVPALIHRLRAQALLAEGKVAAALAEVGLAQAALPASIEAAVRLVPELDKRGRKKEAAAVFARALAVQEKLARDYPRYAAAHNRAAWLSACCGRNLDKALAHARKAVELDAGSAGLHDTLAEVLFQKGMKKEAVAGAKRAVALAPQREYFRKQLKRIEAGDPKAPRPPEEE
jgi:tetratricopeptide (TPR) repeat protein